MAAALGRPRAIYEGPEWDEFAWHVEPDAKRFDEQFLGISNSIHLDAMENSEGLVEDDPTILELAIAYLRR